MIPEVFIERGLMANGLSAATGNICRGCVSLLAMKNCKTTPACPRQTGSASKIHQRRQTLIRSVGLRQSTIERIAEELIVQQRDFLDHYFTSCGR